MEEGGKGGAAALHPNALAIVCRYFRSKFCKDDFAFGLLVPPCLRPLVPVGVMYVLVGWREQISHIHLIICTKNCTLYNCHEWPLLTVETEANGDSRSSYERGPSLVASLGFSCRYNRFLFCHVYSSRPSTTYFFSSQYFNSFILVAQKSGQACRQSWWVIFLLICVSDVHLSTVCTVHCTVKYKNGTATT